MGHLWDKDRSFRLINMLLLQLLVGPEQGPESGFQERWQQRRDQPLRSRRVEPARVLPAASGRARSEWARTFSTRIKARPSGAHGRRRPSRALMSPPRARLGPRRPAANGTMSPREKADASGGATLREAPRARLRIRGGAGLRPSAGAPAGGLWSKLGQAFASTLYAFRRVDACRWCSLDKMPQGPCQAEAKVIAEALGEHLRLFVSHGTLDLVQESSGTLNGTLKGIIRLAHLGWQLPQSHEGTDLRPDHGSDSTAVEYSNRPDAWRFQQTLDEVAHSRMPHFD